MSTLDVQWSNVVLTYSYFGCPKGPWPVWYFTGSAWLLSHVYLPLAWHIFRDHSVEMWKSDQSEYYNAFTNGPTVIVLDEDALEVSAEQGSGYCREAITTYIPMNVLVKLLEHQGYKVSR